MIFTNNVAKDFKFQLVLKNRSFKEKDKSLKEATKDRKHLEELNMKLLADMKALFRMVSLWLFAQKSQKQSHMSSFYHRLFPNSEVAYNVGKSEVAER